MDGVDGSGGDKGTLKRLCYNWYILSFRTLSIRNTINPNLIGSPGRFVEGLDGSGGGMGVTRASQRLSLS